MLGGSVVVAFIRMAVSIGGTIFLFCLMDEPRFGWKKIISIYGIFFLAALPFSCGWYMVARASFVRFAPISLFTMIAVISIYISSTRIYLTMYKLAVTFFLMAVFIIGGIEISTIFFHGSVWADIAVRLIILLIMAYVIKKFIRDSLKEFGKYLESEMDRFSVMVLIISLFFGILYVLRPYEQEELRVHLFRVLTNVFLVGTLQFMVIRLYLHIGKESEYRTENQLMQMNHRLLERQLEFLEESVETGRHIRHDARHHNMVIAEYVRRGQNEELLKYLGEYEKELDEGAAPLICENIAVNNLLSAYTRKAEREQIKVSLDISLEERCSVQDIDLVTILSNAYENAIYGCLEARNQLPDRECCINLLVKRKKNKLVIYCGNTCKFETNTKDGFRKPEFTGGIGVSCIVKSAKNYGGEPDFRIDNGVFVFRLIINVPEEG